MKLKKLSIFGFASMMLIGGMASCSNDLIEEPDQTLEAAETLFIPISVCSYSDGTRGGTLGDYGDNPYNPSEDPNYSEGTDNEYVKENAVNSIFLVFYDSNRERVAYTESILDNMTQTPSEDPNVNKLYSGIVQIDLTEGRGTPTYVLAFINPSSTSDFKGNSFKTLGSVEQLQRTSLISNGQFPMSNSVYYGNHPVTGNSNARIMATPIPNDKIFTSKGAAEAAISGGSASTSFVDIYVERYAGKVNFSIKGATIEELKMKDLDGNEVQLKFVPEAWAVNATEKKSFVTKNFFAANGDGAFDFSQPSSFETLNATLGGTGTKMAWKWNSEENHRSYWGQSPGYYEGRYPRVADDIMDAEGWKPGVHDGYIGSYPLNYYSYNELIKGADGKIDAISRTFESSNNINAIYARENTVSGTSLKKAYDDPTASPKSAIASVVMVGSYQVKRGSGNFEEFEDIFYVTGNEVNGYTFYNKDDILNFFVNNTLSLAKNAQGEPFFNYTTAEKVKDAKFTDDEYKDYFTVEHPSAAVRGNLVMDSRYVTVQLNEKAIGNVWAKVGDVYIEVTADNINTINQSIMSGAGTAYGFQGGKAYFNVPIQHLGFYSPENANKGISPLSSDFDWEKTKSGEFGIVRNHVYTIEATKIAGLGNGIPNPDDPIVPPTEPEYYIGARINVLNWAIVPTQKVEW